MDSSTANSTISSAITSAISSAPMEFIYVVTAVIFTVAMLLESIAPRRKLEGNLFWRWINNFSLGGLSWYVSNILGLWLVTWVAQFAEIQQIGLFNHIGSGPVIGFFVLLLSTQFIGYWMHYAFHNIPWLWPIHAVHHSDTDVDVSTSYRHHPLEALIGIPLLAPMILILGVPFESAMSYQLFAIAGSVFSHCNIKLPERLEKYLRYIILTPDYHRIHHSSEKQFTNSNYGSVIPWFDYVFGTAKHRSYKDQSTMELGLEYLREAKDSRLDQLLATPLKMPRATAAKVENGADLNPKG